MGSSDLETETECRNAVDHVAKFFSGVGFGESGAWTNKPKGCYIDMSSRGIYWNSVEVSGSYTWARSICQVLGDQQNGE